MLYPRKITAVLAVFALAAITADLGCAEASRAREAGQASNAAIGAAQAAQKEAEAKLAAAQSRLALAEQAKAEAAAGHITPEQLQAALAARDKAITEADSAAQTLKAAQADIIKKRVEWDEAIKLADAKAEQLKQQSKAISEAVGMVPGYGTVAGALIIGIGTALAGLYRAHAHKGRADEMEEQNTALAAAASAVVKSIEALKAAKKINTEDPQVADILTATQGSDGKMLVDKVQAGEV